MVQSLAVVPRTRLGFTFTPRQAKQLGVDWRAAFTAALELRPELIRLGTPWSEVEPAPGAFAFDALDWLFEAAETARVPVLLTVGMKSPRWPEFYLPGWLGDGLAGRRWRPISDDPRVRAGVRRLIETVVRRYRAQPALEAWQVENEPLDMAGPHCWRIDSAFLGEEIAQVRALDPTHPLVLTSFALTDPLQALPGTSRIRSARAATLAARADVLGLDIYTAVAVDLVGRPVALHWRSSRWEEPLSTYIQAAADRRTPVWVTELQAEPWEPGQIVHVRPGDPTSTTPAIAGEMLDRVRRLGLPVALLWGVEYWYARRTRFGDDRWWRLFEDHFGRR
ncbi:MAG: beta-galactosidase [Chloroflexi bacterium]|nr:beta-galactosidase [Chloroflexota bacterium]